MPAIALHTYQRRFHTDPPNPPLVADRLRLAVEVVGVELFNPYVFLDPGRPFSVVSHTIAAQLWCVPVPIQIDPVRVEVESPTGIGFVPGGMMPAIQTSAWDGRRCEFVRTSVQFRDLVSGALTAPLDLFAHRPLAVLPNFADRFLILGYSFLRDNSADLTIAPAGSTVGRLVVC